VSLTQDVTEGEPTASVLGVPTPRVEL